MGRLVMDFDCDKLKYLLHYMEYAIIRLVDHVLSDSKTDPEYSAVTASNLIKCYIDIKSELEGALPYKTVEGFFEYNLYTEEEYHLFEENRKKESEYYIGMQY